MIVTPISDTIKDHKSTARREEIAAMPPRLPVAASLDAAATSLTVQCPRRAAFSTTSRRDRVTKGRFDMYTWLNNVADRTFESGRRGASYLGPFTDQPFPSNPLFRSQPVLSEPMRDIIYKKVMEEGNALKAVSEEMGVDVRRVAAVVRLKQVEKRWISDVSFLLPYYHQYSIYIPLSWSICLDYMMRQQNFSISLEDISHGYTLFISF